MTKKSPSRSRKPEPPTISTDQGRGLPYYERLKQDLRDVLRQKRQVDAALVRIEDSIVQMEASYLDDTAAGNVIKGFDNYMKGNSASAASSLPMPLPVPAGGSGMTTRRRAAVVDADRIFSRSSAAVNRDSPVPTTTTPSSSQAPTPSSNAPHSARESKDATPASTTTKTPVSGTIKTPSAGLFSKAAIAGTISKATVAGTTSKPAIAGTTSKASIAGTASKPTTLAPPPATSGPNKGPTTRKKKHAAPDEGDEKPAKRGKITYARE